MQRSAAKADVNRSAILAHLGAQGPATRAALARALGVSPALVTQLTRDLTAEGLIEEGEVERSEGGRPGRRLQLAAGGRTAIGVKIAADHVVFVEVRLDGQILRSTSHLFHAAGSTFLADLLLLLRGFINDAEGTILGIGIGVPGAVDDQSNGVVDAPSLDWRNVPLGATLRAEFALPVVVENDVNALAAAERLYGMGQNHDIFLVITIGYGIGAAIVTSDGVERGAHGGAGEFGHTPTWMPDGTLAALETRIGEAALVGCARKAGIIGSEDGIAALHAAADASIAAAGAATPKAADTTADADADAAPNASSARSAQLLADAGRTLGIALAGAVHLIDPEVVIVSGEGTTAWKHWDAGFSDAFRSALMPTRRGIPVFVENWRDEGWARGAASLVLATPFDAAGRAGVEGAHIRARLQRVATH